MQLTQWLDELRDDLKLSFRQLRRSPAFTFVASLTVRVVGTGAAIGLMLSAFCGRLIQTMLFGVRPFDLATLVCVTLVIGIIAALSILGPAWRAAHIDPAVALRNT